MKEDTAPGAESETPAETRPGPTRAGPQVFVGVGASAGGLEPLKLLFGAMPTDTGAAFVVVQHLSPRFRSLMTDILGRHTRLPVHRVRSGMVAQPNSIYLIPPGVYMRLDGGIFHLAEYDHPGRLHLPIDVFFESMADECGESCLAIVLSGSGRDGSQGVVAVRRSGGCVFVQAPERAQFASMPRAAIESRAVDRVLRVDDMPTAVAAFVREQRGDVDPEAPAHQDPIQVVFDRIRARYGIDFADYKPGTVDRRVERRVGLTRAGSVDRYVDLLRTDDTELARLYNDLLIGVTQFFRDPETFAALQSEIFPQMVPDGMRRELRIWVPACATGEEPYSLAILLDEYLRTNNLASDFQIFGTDVSQAALDFASEGLYERSALEHVSAERLDFYFRQEGDRIRIAPSIRRRVLFTRHNVLTDPVFGDLDLVSCRNLLIYLGSQAQETAISQFRFALRPEGFLLLGDSETLGAKAEGFEPAIERLKIYQRTASPKGDKGHARLTAVLARRSAFPGRPATERGPRWAGRSGTQSTRLAHAYDLLMEHLLPPGVLIDDQRQIIHVFAGAERYLKPPRGRVSLDVLDAVQDQLRVKLSPLVRRSLRDGVRTHFAHRVVEEDGSTPEAIEIYVDPIPSEVSEERYCFVGFRPLGETTATDEQEGEASESQTVELLTQELRQYEEHLAQAVQDLELSHEDLQATNEELLASNEELQSTNEELQSVNEELNTVNSEFESKIRELQEANNDLELLMESMQVGTLFLDTGLHIRKFTSRIVEVLNVLPQDVGRPIHHVTHNLKASPGALAEAAAHVLEHGGHREFIHDVSVDEVWLVRLQRYRDSDDLVTGVVVTLMDTTRPVQAQRVAQDAHDRMEALAESIPANIAWVDRDLIYRWVSPAYGVFADAKDVAGKHVKDVLGTEGMAVTLPYIQRALAGEGVRYEANFSVAGRRERMAVAYTPSRNGDGEVTGFYVFAFRLDAWADGDEILPGLGDGPPEEAGAAKAS